MPIIYRYIYKSMISSICSVTLTMTSLVSVFAFIGELEAFKNNYHFPQALWYIITTMPGTTFEILPFICLVSVLLVMGSLAENNELTVLRTSGFSSLKLSALTLSFIFALSCFFVILDSTLFSRLNSYGLEFKTQHKYPTRNIDSFGFWMLENNAVMYLSSVTEQGNLAQSHIYQFDDHRKVSKIQDSGSGSIDDKVFRFDELDSTSISDTSHVDIQIEKNVVVNTDYNINFQKLEKTDPRLLSLANLYDISRFQNKLKEGGNRYWATFLSKVLLPINICALAFLSLNFVFGSTRSLSTGSRVFIGIVVGLVFYFINRLSVPLHLALNIPAVITTLTPGILALIIGWIVIKKTKA